MKSDQEILALCDRVRQMAFELHAYLRHGHLEKVYENGLTHRLRRAGMTVEQQCPLQVRDEDRTILILVNGNHHVFKSNLELKCAATSIGCDKKDFVSTPTRTSVLRRLPSGRQLEFLSNCAYSLGIAEILDQVTSNSRRA